MPSARSSSRSRRSARPSRRCGDPYLAARIDDIRVVGTRLIRNLLKKPYVAYSSLTGGAIILAEEMTPGDTALMDPRRIGGFAAEFGGAGRPYRDHGARARAAGGARGSRLCSDWARAGAPVLVDGTEGVVIIDPAPGDDPRLPRPARGIGPRAARPLARLRRLPAVTRDGVEIAARSQSRTAGRARARDGQRRDGAGPRAHRIPLHEPRGPAERGRTVRVFRRAGARHGRPAGHPAHPRCRRRQAARGAGRLCRVGQREPGARPARDPPVVAGPPAARCAARGDAARRQ